MAVKKIDNQKQSALDRVRAKAASHSGFRRELMRAATFLAEDSILGRAPQHDDPRAVTVFNLQGNSVGRYLGPAVTRTGFKLTGELRVAYAQAVVAWASALLADSSFKGGSALERVEYRSRAISGVQRGKRLSDAELAKLEESIEDLEEFQFRSQKLVFYKTGATAAAYAALSRFDEGLYDDVEVEVEPVNFKSFEDDASASEDRQRRDSDWLNVFIDGQVVGVHRLYGGDSWSLDDEVDPTGFNRREDARVGELLLRKIGEFRKAHPENIKRALSEYLGFKEWLAGKRLEAIAEEKAEVLRFEAWREAKREAKQAKHWEFFGRFRRAEYRRALGSDEARAEHTLKEKRRAERAAEISAARRDAAIARVEAERVGTERRIAVGKDIQADLNARFGVPGAHRGNEAGAEGFKRARTWKHDGLSNESVNRIVASMDSTVLLTNDHKRQLQADEEEVRRYALHDTAAWSTRELFDETIQEYTTSVIFDDDLDVEKAIRAVPALAGHRRDHKKLNKMPKGLMAAFANARAMEEKLAPIRAANNRFLEGLANLEAANAA